MKVLTIKEPYATLIIEGYKKYEFRSWKTNYRGKILIHAGLTLEKEVVKKFEDYNLDYSKGQIIGEAEIVDCIKVDEEFQKSLISMNPLVYGKSNHVENYAWKLENVKKYKNKIDVKGKLGLWNYGYHKMNLNNEPFEAIRKGTKTIEMRLNDEKRSIIKVNDIIEFNNILNNEIIKVKVINLHNFKTFEELYKNFNKIELGYKENEKANFSDMNKYYSLEEQDKYGVVGIEISLIS